ncbi:MAG: hypothetical protein AAF517_04885 [Planctomycetota bacterium]
MSGNFDQVAVQKAGGFNLYTKVDWDKFALDLRVRLIREKRVQFLRGGKVIPMSEAFSVPAKEI